MWMWGEAEWRRTSGSWQEGTVFSLSPTHWPSDAAELTAPDYRAMAAGEGGRGINWDFREEKTGRLTKWGKREWGITALVMAAWAGAWNNLRHSPVHVYVHGCVSACCGCDIQTSTMKEMKGYEGVKHYVGELHVKINAVHKRMHAKASFFFQHAMWETSLECKESMQLRRRESPGHGAPLKPCAANQLQLVPHPHKDSLMWARPLNSTQGSHKAALAVWSESGETLFGPNNKTFCTTTKWPDIKGVSDIHLWLGKSENQPCNAPIKKRNMLHVMVLAVSGQETLSTCHP